MKNLFLILVIIISIIACTDNNTENYYYKKYKVKITFCDVRPPDTIIIEDSSPPKNYDISTYKRAVPKWGDYLNVCDLKVLDTL